MKIFYDFDNAGQPLSIKNPVVTTGSFDGVHAGHMQIIESLKRSAKKIGGESVLITFYPHPRKVLHADTDGKNLFLINSQKEKIHLLEKAGLDNLFIINFTKEFSEITPVDFIRKILIDKLHVSKVIIGFNHHFGYNRTGDFQYLFQLGKYYNFEVEEIPEHIIRNETVSSTKIRKALQEGDIQKANAYLDNLFIISGKLKKWKTQKTVYNEQNQLSGITTYGIVSEEESKLIPLTGVYAAKCIIDNKVNKALVNIKPEKVNGLIPFLEICILHDVDIDLTGKECTLCFAKRIRNQMEFKDDNSFSIQLKKDINKVDELIY